MKDKPIYGQDAEINRLFNPHPAPIPSSEGTQLAEGMMQERPMSKTELTLKQKISMLIDSIPNIHLMPINPSMFSGILTDDCRKCPNSMITAQDQPNPSACRDCWKTAVENTKVTAQDLLQVVSPTPVEPTCSGQSLADKMGKQVASYTEHGQVIQIDHKPPATAVLNGTTPVTLNVPFPAKVTLASPPPAKGTFAVISNDLQEGVTTTRYSHNQELAEWANSLSCEELDKEVHRIESNRYEEHMEAVHKWNDLNISKEHKEVSYPIKRNLEYVEDYYYGPLWSPATNWEQGGEIIEREKIEVCRLTIRSKGNWAVAGVDGVLVFGDTMLMAAMRHYVRSNQDVG